MTTFSSRSKIIPLVVSCAYFMENFDGTVIATALPSMARSFSTSAPATSIGITAYMLTVAMFIPPSGWLADRYGCRTVFRGAIGLFTLASLLCALSHTLVEFTAARALQGIGGAMMVPVGRLIVLRATDRAEYMRAMAWVTMPGVVGQMAGPVVGGFFATYLGWRWIFYINLPMGLLGMLLVSFLIDNRRGFDLARFDWRGACMVGAAAGCLVCGLSFATSQQGAMRALPLLACGILAGVSALRHLRSNVGGVLDLRLFALPTFARAASGNMLFRASASGFSFLLPLVLQIGLGMSAFASGLLVLASSLGAFLMKAYAPPVLRRFGFRGVLLYNGIVCAASMFTCALFGLDTPRWTMGAILFVGGFARSLQFAALNTVVYADVEPQRMSAATSFASMLQPLASACGITASAVVLRVVGGAAAHAGLPLFGLRITLLGVSALALCAAWPFLGMAQTAGSAMSGRREALSRPAETR